MEEQHKKRDLRNELLHTLLPFIGMIFVIALFAVLTKGKLIEGAGLKRMMTQAYTVVLVGMGASFIYMHGGIDFSLGSYVRGNGLELGSDADVHHRIRSLRLPYRSCGG